MGLLARLLGGAGRPGGWEGESGRPRSANGASSFHLFWDVPSSGTPVVAVEAVLEVRTPPAVPDLVFWAMQATFVDRGRNHGGAHLGLQWHPGHPGGTAVNWGGYGPDGAELAGSLSALPSATGNPNTRDYDWRPLRRYRLRIDRGEAGWRGTVQDLADGTTTVVRELRAGGAEIVSPMVWSEVFADCSADAGSVVWSDLVAEDASGTRHPVRAVRVSYQALSEGGCSTTDVRVDGSSVVQITGTNRTTPPGSLLKLAD